MKKSIFLAVLGLAVGVSASYGQGFVAFTSYGANNLNGATTTIFGSSNLASTGFTASLYYFIGTISDPVNNSSIASITSPVTGLALLPGVTSLYLSGDGAGYFLVQLRLFPAMCQVQLHLRLLPQARLTA